MQEKSVVVGSNADAIRLLDARAVLSHYAHLKSRPGESRPGCGFCAGGLGAVVKEVKEPEPKADVVQDSGAYEEEDSSSSRSRRRSWEEEGQVRKAPKVS